MLYIESPAGVGFSYSDDKTYVTNDTEVSLAPAHLPRSRRLPGDSEDSVMRERARPQNSLLALSRDLWYRLIAKSLPLAQNKVGWARSL